MKNITSLFVICFIYLACEKKDDGSGYKLVSHFTLDSTRSDKNNYSSNTFVALHGSLGSSIDEPNGTGKIGSCLNLLRTTTLECRDNLFFNYKSEYHKAKDYSISFWFKINDNSGGDPNIFYCISSNTSSTPDFFGIGLKNDSLVLAHYDAKTFPGFIKFQSIDFEKYEWNNIVVTSNSNYKLYLNGNLVYTASRTVSGSQYLDFIQLGNDILSASIYMYVDELIVYNYPITSTDVSNYYNATK